jgi:hypothetical protein
MGPKSTTGVSLTTRCSGLATVAAELDIVLLVRLMNRDGPEDAGEFVGQCDGGAVVSAAMKDGEGPGLEAVGAFNAGGGEQGGAGAVNEEGAQIGITTFRDGAEVTAQAAGKLARDQAPGSLRSVGRRGIGPSGRRRRPERWR